MAINTHESTNIVPLSHRPAHLAQRISLGVLAALVTFTAIQGAVFVVPTMPSAVLRQGVITPFSDYTIPAFALGILCGGSALVALITVILWPRVGGLASAVAGAFMIGFELIEILVVGFTPVLYPTQPQGWLQVFFLVVGALMVALGLRLWRADVVGASSR